MATSTGSTVEVAAGGVPLTGALSFPPHARGVVVLARGSGPDRRSPRDRAVVEELVRARLATLLLDLLTSGEEADHDRDAHVRSDAGLLGARVAGAIDWLAAEAVVGDLPPSLRRLPVGCFGAGTGAAAALIAAAERPDRVAAVVARGGRPDLARAALGRVTAPALLIDDGDDPETLRRYGAVQALLGGESRLARIAGDRAAALTRDWFVRHLAPGPGPMA